jgi:hypothetical protein
LRKSLGRVVEKSGAGEGFERLLPSQNKYFESRMHRGKKIGVDESVDRRKAALRAAVKY